MMKYVESVSVSRRFAIAASRDSLQRAQIQLE